MPKRGSEKWADDPLVVIDAARLRAMLLLRRTRSRAEIARRAGMSKQKLDYLVRGKNQRCRQSARAGLARTLGCSVAYLAGRADALPPGLLTEGLAAREAAIGGGDSRRARRELALEVLPIPVMFAHQRRVEELAKRNPPPVDEWAAEMAAFEELLEQASGALPEARDVRVGGGVVRLLKAADMVEHVAEHDMVAAEATALAREIARCYGELAAPAFNLLMLALMDVLEVRFWRSLLRQPGPSALSESDSPAFAAAMSDALRLALTPFANGEEQPTAAAVPGLARALQLLRDLAYWGAEGAARGVAHS